MPERNQKRKAMRVRSLRQRWILNSALPVFMLLALAVGGMSIGISNYYYKGMLDGLERQARAQAGAFIDYFMDQGFANYLQRANQAISDYTDKERVELQFLSSTGGIQASSTSNLTVGTHPGTEDISRAVETNKISYYRGADPKTGEQILAVSHPLTVNGKVVGVMRFVTSMRQVTVQVRMTVLAVVLVAAYRDGTGFDASAPTSFSSTTWWSRWRWCRTLPSGSRRGATASRWKTNIPGNWAN